MEDPKDAPATETVAVSTSPEFVEKVQGHLDAFNESVDETDVAELAVSPDDDTPAAKVPPVEGETAPADEGGEKATESESKVEEAAVTETPAKEIPTSTLPAAYRRTAKARDWTDEDIDNFMEKDPELALRTLGRMHESRIKEVNEWAAIGRRTKTPAPATVPEVPVSGTPVGLQPINVQSMIDKFGNDELIQELAGPVNAAIAALQPIMQRAQMAEGVAARSAQDTLGKQIEGFFAGDEMKGFGSFYGTDLRNLTPEQLQTRCKVLEMADALIMGASSQGRQLNVEEALTLAHDSVSVTHKEQAIREQIKGSVKMRQKAITLKPSRRGSGQNDGPPKDRQELEHRAAKRLHKAFE